ncbi:MAG: flagellar export chaperone FlgN [Planctomycetaceae bacterium]|nr:flagellar export chaperone FlgN [Planctomycetaceae bacterium]
MPSDGSWEAELAGYLNELSATQDELLAVLKRKLGLLATADREGLLAVGELEQALSARLQDCYQKRCAMLERAQQQGLPADSLKSLAGSLPREQRRQLEPRVAEAAGKSRLLQHQSLTNWVVTQRSLLHLSHLLEIIATGGKLRPTYGNEESDSTGGALLDRAV